MRLFYDLYSSRARAEALLIAADAATVSIATLYSTAALAGGGSAWDIALIPLWAAIPRAIARILESLDRPRAGYRAALGVAAIGALVAVFAVLGHGLISSVAPPAALRDPFLLAVLFFAWASGILLCHPAAYRLHDVLIFSTLLLGLKESRPLAWVLVPPFLAAFFLSCAVRHLLLDAFPGRRDPPWNLQNARAASLVAASAVSAAFVIAALALGAGSHTAEDARSRGLEISRQEDASRGRDAGGDGASDGPFVTEERTDVRGSPGAPRVGFSYRVGLRELAYARLDAREVARIGPDPADPASGGWRPAGDTLWKGITLSSYDAESESWIEESRLMRMAWPASGALELPHGLPPDAPRAALHVTVVTPVLKSAVQPYVTRRVLSTHFTGYSVSPMGDIFPHPPIARGTSYRMDVSSLDATGIAGNPGHQTDPRFLALPPPAALGIDLRPLARSIFKDATDADSRVDALRAHFASKGFRYSNRASWRGKDPVARFIRDEKIGSCAYFATAAALLLRAGGVETRLAAGFLGGTWDGERGQAILRNRDAHAWVEVFSPRAGWRPIDPTGWVPLDSSYNPPPEVPPLAGDQPFETTAQSESQWADRALDADASSRATPVEDRGKDRPWTLADSGVAPSIGRREDFTDELEEAVALQSWIDYREAAIGETIDLAGGTPPAGDGGEAGESAARLPLKPRFAPRTPLPYNALPRQEGPGTRLRVAIILLGGAVLSLLVLILLRPRKKMEDGDESLEAANAIDETGALLPADGMLLDETDPRDRVLADYMRLQTSLERTRSHRRPHQTPVEHGRLVTRQRKGLEAAFRELHGILYRLIYGGGRIEEKHAEAARRCCRRIKRYLG